MAPCLGCFLTPRFERAWVQIPLPSLAVQFSFLHFWRSVCVRYRNVRGKRILPFRGNSMCAEARVRVGVAFNQSDNESNESLEREERSEDR
jgi:hypothetical protein